MTANCAHPGVVRTGFGRESRPLLRLGVTIARPFMLSPERDDAAARQLWELSEKMTGLAPDRGQGGAVKR